MRLPRLMIAAPRSGSGKTMITCALLELMKEYLKPQGRQVKAFKCGPDYIDPLFHREIIGVSSRNLDCFFSDEEQIRELFRLGQREGDLSVIEGGMGLYDGLGGISEEASSYQLAKTLQVPIVLVVDAKGMGRSVLPLLAGFLEYDTAHLIQGVILNRVSPSFGEILKKLIEETFPLKVLGYFPEQKGMELESRHLGLKLPGEVAELEEQVKKATGELGKTLDPEHLLAFADTAPEISGKAESVFPVSRVRIGIAQDEAFCFYYEDNLRILREKGAELVPFSPLWDEELPKDLDGILLGGGYPELWGEQLQKNVGMRQSIQKAIAGGMPSIAECGGFMYLHEKLEDLQGQTYDMCGVLPGVCQNTGKLTRFGYITLTANGQTCFLPEGQSIRAHEFHYFDSTVNGNDCRAVKPLSGREWSCAHADAAHWWGFPHLYYPSKPQFAENYIAAAIAYKNCQLAENMR